MAAEQPQDDPAHESHDDHFRAPQQGTTGEERRERFQAREIAQVLSHYDLGVISRIQEYRRGSRRSPKLKLQSERGDFLLKRKQSGYSHERAIASHALQARAEEAGVPVAGFVQTRKGGTLLAFGERLYELQNWVTGVRYERDPAQAYEAGVALARMHGGLAGVAQWAELPTGGFSDTDFVHRSLLLADAAARERVSGAAERSELSALVSGLSRHLELAEQKLVEKGLPLQEMVVCHGDFHPGNTLWLGVSLSAVIDFDSVRNESVAAEVANALLQFSLKHRVGDDPDAWQIGLDPDRLQALGKGYMSEMSSSGASSGAELALLAPWLMIPAVISEAAAPIARDGDFAGIPAVPFLRATARLVDWIAERTRAISTSFSP